MSFNFFFFSSRRRHTRWNCDWSSDVCSSDLDAHGRLRQEWLVTNGLGGYASGTISGAVSWRYHGLLIAALPSPLGRVRSEERRVGKECRSRWSRYHYKQKRGAI